MVFIYYSAPLEHLVIFGHIYYRAGVVVLTSSIFTAATPTMTTASTVSTIGTGSVEDLFVSGTIDECSNHD